MAAAVAFFISWSLFRDEKEEKEEKEEKKEKEEKDEKAEIGGNAEEKNVNVPYTVYSPLSGTIIPMKEVKDPTFAS